MNQQNFLSFWVVVYFCSFAYPAFCDPPSEQNLGSLELVAEGLNFPSNIVSLPDDDANKIYILEKNEGKIRVIEDGKLSSDAFLDIGDMIGDPVWEQGLIGLAFPPDFKTRKHIYVTYTDWKDNSERNPALILSRFQVSEDGKKAIKSSEEKLLIAENFVTEGPNIGHHYCGHIEFDSQGKYLYLCIGDSDDQGNPNDTSQSLNFIQGKILRLDVESGQKPYGIPPDNPFVATEGARPEVWAYGLRNPWKFSFDPLTGDLYIPDTGWEFFEEINFQPDSSKGGGNYGWNLAEGNECRFNCEEKNLKWPIHELPHGKLGCAMVGGMVYRGEKYPKWNGVYLFADFCRGHVWAIRNIPENPQIRLVFSSGSGSTAVSPDPKGEVLIADWSGGKIHRLLFPSYEDGPWESQQDFYYRTMIEARRVGLVAKKLEYAIDRFRLSLRWRLLQPFSDFYNWIGRPFDSEKVASP